VQIKAPNVHCVSAKPYAEMPRYIRSFDVCVQPWRGVENRWTSYGSSIKVREYLATGKPVVISPLYEYMQTPGIIFFHNADEFIAAIEYALANDTPAARGLRQSAVRDGTWDVRARQVGTLISSLLAGGNAERLFAVPEAFQVREDVQSKLKFQSGTLK
jgi:glycosyltransferase involved in cell wall biosynthesis